MAADNSSASFTLRRNSAKLFSPCAIVTPLTSLPSPTSKVLYALDHFTSDARRAEYLIYHLAPNVPESDEERARRLALGQLMRWPLASGA